MYLGLAWERVEWCQMKKEYFGRKILTYFLGLWLNGIYHDNFVQKDVIDSIEAQALKYSLESSGFAQICGVHAVLSGKEQFVFT